MGKTYKVFPQIINSYYTNVHFDVDDLKFYNLDIPPLVGQYTDGEYVLYSKKFELKNKRKVDGFYTFDTIRNVFAIIAIKNNKKEGIATVFDEDTKLPKFRIPYKNDMIDGHFVLYQKEDNNNRKRYGMRRSYEWDAYDYAYEYRDYGKGHTRLNYTSKKIVLTYKEGFVDELVLAYGCTKKDTFLLDSISVSKGWLNGPKTSHYYERFNKKAVLNSSTHETYKDNQIYGVKTVINHEDKTVRLEHYDDEGSITAEQYYAPFGHLITNTVYGKDSLEKHYPDYKSLAVVPDVSTDDNYNRSDDYEYQFVQRFEKGQMKSVAIKAGDKVSLNYCASERYELRDTIMNNLYYRIEQKSYFDRNTIAYYLIDTCQYSKSTKPCAKLYTRQFYYIKNNLSSYTEKTKLYYQMNPSETVVFAPVSTVVRHGLEVKKYYYGPLNYHFYNHLFISGNNKGIASYYRVSGDQKTGSIIHYIKIPMKYDSLLLVDTIMHKGQYVYKLDKTFYDAYDKFLLTSESSSSIRLSYNEERYDNFSLMDEMIRYFKLIPVQHKSIYVGRQAFSGNVEFNWDYKKTPNGLKAKLYEIKQTWALKPTLVVDINLEVNQSMLKSNKSKFIAPTKKIKINSSYGSFFGTYSVTDVFNHNSTYTHYNSNQLNDDVEYTLYSTNKRWKKTLKMDNMIKQESSMMNYEYGKKEGQWQINTENSYSTPMHQLVYHNNQLNGTQYQFRANSGYKFLGRVYNMKNDTVHGYYWKLARNGYPTLKGHFNMGVPDGTFIRYNVSDFKLRDTGKYILESLPFKHGYLDGTYKLYRDTNNLKYTVQLSIKDSMYYTVFKTTRNYESESDEHYVRPRVDDMKPKVYNGSDFVDNLPTRFKSGYYTYYYKSGFVFKQGQKHYSEPNGIWHFYREGQGRLYKTIDFKDSVVYLSAADSIGTVGRVKAYYDNGQLMYEAWAQNMDTKYTCESEADMPTEEDHYLSFFDENGKSMLENGSGVITELQASGHKLKEGRVEQFKKQGVWVYYNNYGQAEAMGLFENGLKVGRWIKGDLSGLHLSEKVCFMSNEEYFDWIAQYGGDLNFQEEYYNKGQLIQSNGVETIRR